MKRCSQCNIPIDQPPNNIGYWQVCNCCFELYLAIAGNPYFIMAHNAELIREASE